MHVCYMFTHVLSAPEVGPRDLGPPGPVQLFVLYLELAFGLWPWSSTGSGSP
jgi:hypothetical protein